MEPYYEQKFSTHSHGFRPHRSCHTALKEVQKQWTGTVWFIEGDITGCFDNIDHTVLLEIIKRDIHDDRLTKLLEGLLKAGYMEDWKYYDTLSGTPQGGIISPLLANIYLNRSFPDERPLGARFRLWGLIFTSARERWPRVPRPDGFPTACGGFRGHRRPLFSAPETLTSARAAHRGRPATTCGPLCPAW
jgi:hypothetical protein